MPALTEQEQEVVDRFWRLSPDRQRHVMLAMFRTDSDRWRRHQPEGQQRLRELASKRGLDWDQMGDDQRQDFVDDLLHEGPP